MPFKLYKLRTMKKGSVGPASTSSDDPRLTKIGRLLRKYKLDELPQLYNILKGDMAFVGPRPEVKEVVDLMTAEEKGIILSVKPGLTDLASVWNFNEEERLAGKADPHKAYLEEIWPEKKRLQILYISKKGLWLDLQVIVLTIKKIFFRG